MKYEIQSLQNTRFMAESIHLLSNKTSKEELINAAYLLLFDEGAE